MNSNILIRLIALAAVLVVAIIATMSAGDDNDKRRAVASEGLSAIDQAPAPGDNGIGFDPIDETELALEYGVDKDTPEATMLTLTRQTQGLRDESVRLQEENKALQAEINRLLGMEDTLERRVDEGVEEAQAVITKEREQLTNQRNRLNQVVERLEKKMAEIERGARTSTGSASEARTPGETLSPAQNPGGNGIVPPSFEPASSANGYDIANAHIPAGLGYGEDKYEHRAALNAPVVWIQPLDASVNEKTGEVTLPEVEFIKHTRSNDSALSAGENGAQSKADSRVAFYTIPANSTLMGSTSMTALLGRIPINGQLEDPYAFKIIVGAQNLATNGLSIPNVAGIVMSGTAVGDWNLSCARGVITSMTFTFADGSIRTLPEQQNLDQQANKDVELGWISDQWGIPCVRGERITNAPEYLATKIALTTAEGYASAAAQGEITTESGVNGGIVSGLTGDAGKYAANKGVADGVGAVNDWYDQRMGSSFDAIYVKPGTPVTVHIDRQLDIDLDPEGRKVNHYAHVSPPTRTLD